ncbi:MAG TPA: thioesterase family protein [Steroidobacter sp.]
MRERQPPGTRADYARFDRITTRWMDNDIYGHVNNTVYYSYFDSAVNRLLIDAGLLDLVNSSVIGLVAETQCRYFSPICFPDEVHAGVRVAHAGTSSVRYEIGLFRNHEPAACAEGSFVHVYVNRDSRRPTPLTPAMRAFVASMSAMKPDFLFENRK